MKTLLKTCGIWIMLSAFTGLAEAKTPDPCDFASGGNVAFPYAQVMSCYRQVPFSEAALHNILQVVAQHRSFSDLAEIYDTRIHWKRKLEALDRATERTFPNDFSIHEALKREHKEFRNAHVAYQPPACYWRMLNAFVPLEFGSTVLRSGGRKEQIIFVEDAPVLPDLYQATTGIDARKLIGLRVVSINGVPVLDYLRRFGEQVKTYEDAGGALNGILTDFDYSMRLGWAHDFVPDRSEDNYVFESVDGRRQVVTLPWVFALSSQILGELAAPLPPTSSTEEFVRQCEQGPANDPPASDAGVRLGQLRAPYHTVDRHRHDAVRRIREHRQRHARSDGYFEVAPEQLGKKVQEIIPLTASARVVQVDGHVTALQLHDTVEWIDQARQGIEYACAHSDRLIIDVRNNRGGDDATIRWLHHHLIPQDGMLVAAGQLPVRMRNDNPTFSEILYNAARATAEFLPELGNDPCALVLVPGCLVDVDTGAPLSARRYDWAQRPSHSEWRGGQLVSLSRQFGLPGYSTPTFDRASCAGRFTKDNLVIVTNGTNVSGGYFLPAAFKDDGVLVNTGGFLGEPMAMGRGRGGATFPASIWAPTTQWIEMVSNGQITFRNPIFGLQRPVDSYMEMPGAYRKDRRTLHINDPVEADLRVPVWTNQTGSEAFVYERVLRAVDKRH